MSQSNLELRLSRWLDDGPHSAPNEVVEAGLSQARTERQLRVVSLPWPRLPRLTLPDDRLLAQAAASFAAITLAVIIAIWGFSNAVVPPAATPSPTIQPSTSPTPSASPTPSPTNTATPSPTSLGGGWSVPELIGAGEFDDVSMAVDARGTVHVAAAISIGAGDSRGIVYMTNASGQWTTEQVTVAPSGQDSEEYDGEPDIAVDPADGSVWIAFTRYDCGGCTPGQSNAILVMNDGSGSWTAPEQVAESQAHDPSLAVSNGVAHLAYAFGQMPGQPNFPSFYATNESGSWVSTQLAPEATLPQLMLEEETLDSVPPVPVVAYSHPTGVSLTWLLSDAQTTTTVTGPDSSVEALFLLLDPVGLIHVVWDDGAGVLHDVTVGDGPSTTGPDLTLNRLLVDGVASLDNGLLVSARGLDEANLGPWSVGSTGIRTRLVAGETTMTDIAYSGRRGDSPHFVYSYAGDQADHGIWYSVSLNSE